MMQEYPWFDQVPDGLKTKTQLSKEGLKPGGEPVAYVYWKRRKRTYYLYSADQAVPKRKMSEKQRAALEKAHDVKRIKRQTCEHCGAIDPGTDYSIEWHVDDRSGYEFHSNGPRWCPTCRALSDRRDHESEQLGFAADAAKAVNEARVLLTKPESWVVLDTETTGLGMYAQVVQVAVLSSSGEILLDTLVKPTCEVESGARSVHHISDEMLRSAPSFWDIYPALVKAVEGKRVVVYNASYDSGVLAWCCELYDLPLLPVKGWWCAMEWYAPYAGEWSEYHGDYRWQRLGGDHTALGDCQATLSLIRRVAQDRHRIDEHQRLEALVASLDQEWRERAQG